MSLYYDVLQAALAAVSAVASLEGVPVALHKRPRWQQQQHEAIQVLVAPEEDLAERLAEGESSEHYGGGAELVFRVYVGLFHDERFDAETLRRRLEWREGVRKALWSLKVAGVPPGGFDVEYDPSGAGAQRVNAPNVDESWQRFDYTLSADRTDDEGG